MQAHSKGRKYAKNISLRPKPFSTRWTVEYYDRAAGKSDAPTSSSSNVEVVAIQKKCATLTQAQKFHKAMNTARTLDTLKSEGGMKTFKTRMVDRQSLINLWQTQDRVRKTEDVSGTSSATNNGITPSQSKKKSKKKSNKKSKERKQFLRDHEKDCDDKSNIIPPSRTDLQAKFSQPKEMRDIQEEGRGKEHVRKEMNGIKMPKKMLKRRRPKGAELTVIGLPKSNKAKKGLLPFSKVRAGEKDRILLGCFVLHSVANKAVKSGYLISAEEVESNVHKIPDMIRDKENVDLPRIDAWKTVLNASERKSKSKWMCPGCSNTICYRDGSIAGEKCQCWYHVRCTSLKGPPKIKSWFCNKCKAKHL